MLSPRSAYSPSEIQQEQQAVDSAQTILKLEQGRYETGIDPYIDVLIAQTTVLAEQQTLNTLQVEADDRCCGAGGGSGRRLGSIRNCRVHGR